MTLRVNKVSQAEIQSKTFPQQNRHKPEHERGAGLAHDHKNDWSQRTCGKRGGRGITGEEGDCEPDDAKGQAGRPGNGEKTAEEGRDPFAAPKFLPGRKQMAKKGAERGDERKGARRKMRNGQNRDGTLQKIEEKGERGQVLAAGARNVGRANIAGADRAKV